MLNKWKKIKEEEYRAGYYKMLKKTFEMPDGRTAVFDVRKEGKTAAILALTEKNTVILAKQFRPGPERILFELPGGFVEENEDVMDAAARELLEETGFTGQLTLIETTFDPYSDGEAYNFIAQNCHQVADPKLDENEFIEIAEVTLDEFKELLRRGDFSDVHTGYLGLDYLKLL